MAAFVTVNPVTICDAAAGGRERAGCGAPLKKRKARAPRQKPALRRRTQADGRGYRSVPPPRVSKRAKLVFAHGTTDPVAEAAFLVGETLGIHPDHVEARAGMARDGRAAEENRRRWSSGASAPASPRPICSSASTCAACRSMSTSARSCRARSSARFSTANCSPASDFSLVREPGCDSPACSTLHRLGMSRDPGRVALSAGEGRCGRAFQGCDRGRQAECRGPSPEETRSAVARRSVRAGQGRALRSDHRQSALRR